MNQNKTQQQLAQQNWVQQHWGAVAEVILIFLIFAIHVGWLVPHVNEAHYLTKAKHYWNNQWCENDFFLASSDAHELFYWTIGSLTLFFSLPTVALIGRIIVWGLLAFAWQRFSWTVAPQRWLSILTAAIFVALNEHFHMAGEWVIGGVEAKCIAYAFVFLALAEMLKFRWNRALILLGIASAFHVLVGGWAVVALAFCWLCMKQERPKLISLWPGLSIGLLLALPGLVPAIMLSTGVDAETVAESNRIYTYERLPHHLLITKMKSTFIIHFGFLILLFTGMFLVCKKHSPVRRLGFFVFGTLAITAIGIAITFATRDNPLLSAKLLRYYWYRLADVALALGVASLCGCFVYSWPQRMIQYRNVLVVALIALSGWSLVDSFSGDNRAYPPAETPKKIANYDDWIDVCSWINSSNAIPQNATFLTPRSNHSFKWHTGLREVVTWKDIPQDPKSIVTWFARMNDLHRSPPESASKFSRSLAARGTENLMKLGKKYNAQYALCRRKYKRPVKIELPVIYENDTFIIYKLY